MSVVLDVRDLVGHPGASREVHLAEPVVGLATELAFVPDDRALDADLLLESVVEGVLVSGRLGGVLVESCARCLTPFEQPFELRVQELFAPDAAAAEADEYPLVEGQVDLEPMIRDAIVLFMPFSPLCRPDCQGLCERCGGNRNLGECECPPAPGDARWSALAALDMPDLLDLPDLPDLNGEDGSSNGDA
jgi:uncharacterized protein